MNEEFKKEWVAALRSDKYVQGTKMLKTDDNKFCCLGVACDLLVKKGILAESINSNRVAIFGSLKDSYDYSYETLPNAARMYIDLPDSNPVVLFNEERLSLAEFNDRGKTFEEIADIIEQTL